MKYPVSKKIELKEEKFGTTVEDPYRWMENENEAELEKWISEQNALTQSFLDTCENRKKFKKKLEDVFNIHQYGVVIAIGEKVIYSLNKGDTNQPIYYIEDLSEKSGKSEILIDPNKLSSDGTVAINFAQHSDDNRYLPYLEATSGSDWHKIKILDLQSGENLKDIIEWVKFTNISWYDNGFFYSAYDAPNKNTELSELNQNMKIFYHKLGTNQNADICVFEDAKNPLRYNIIKISKNKKHLLLDISEGTSGTEYRYAKMPDEISGKINFNTILEGFKYNHHFIGNYGDELLFLSDMNAENRRIFSIDSNELSRYSCKNTNDVLETIKIKDVVTESSHPIENVNKCGDKLFLTYLVNVTSKIEIFDIASKKSKEINLDSNGSVLYFTSDSDSNNAFFVFTSFLEPVSIYQVDIEASSASLFKKPKPPINTDDYVSKQVFYESKDGTKISMFINYKKGLELNAKNPCLLYAYGGFNISMQPAFAKTRIPLLDEGGIYAVANIRGGGEYGEKWHKGGMLLNKQNVFDDFISAAEYLIDKKYTSREHIAIDGGSNGGLLIGAVLNQRPDLFRVGFPEVGVLDMLRYHLFTVGWGWTPEYGNPDEREHFENIRKYSPLHNIEEKDYPAVMVMTADHDDRVVPAHSFKYIATLQEKGTGINPYLIRIDAKAGHGMGKSNAKIIEQHADLLAFMLKFCD